MTTAEWIDSHCHVFDERMEHGADAALDAARVAGVTGFVVIGTDRETSVQAIELAARRADTWATVGLHPHDAHLGVDTIEDLVTSPRVIAIGECGLDFHYDNSPRDTQRDAFAQQIALAKANDLTLVIHTREAWDDTFDVLDAEGTPSHTVIHCFTGGPEEARKCLDRGAFLSFSGVVTFKNAQPTRDAAMLCPADRLIVETDAPYLAPVPHRGRTNEPAFVAVVGQAIADLRGVSAQTLSESSRHATLLAFPRMAS